MAAFILHSCVLPVRAALLGVTPTPPCTCSRLQPPTLTDLEYDEFICKVVSKEQVVAVAVVDSSRDDATSGRTCQSMLEGLYRKANR